MTYSTLERIVKNRANEIKENAGYMGSWDDGGSHQLLEQLEKYKMHLIYQKDLRPSEYYKLNDLEIGEPNEFAYIIEKEKFKKAMEIVENIKL